jgi:hypothetical protein
MASSIESLDAYAVEIRVALRDGKYRRGSGYVVGPCRILTALHVLLGEETLLRGAMVSCPDKIEVRTQGDFASIFGDISDVSADRSYERLRAAAPDGDFLWRPAHMLWPVASSETPRYDLAVLEVTPSDALEHVREAPVVGSWSPRSDTACRGTGFPTWTDLHTSDSDDLANPCTVAGELTLAPTKFRGAHPFTAKNGGPEKVEEWQGLSGAAFFSTSPVALVAIASEVRRGASNTGLWLTRLGDVARNPSFDGFWVASGLTRPIGQDAARARSVFVVGGVTGETDYPDYEMLELGNTCRQLGDAIARAGAALIVCSPFQDSADVYSVMGYVQADVGGIVHFHSPRHTSVEQRRAELNKMLDQVGTKFIDWHYPGPETDDAWGQAWLLSQLQALSHADLVVAIGGRLSKTANTLLHLAEDRKIPIVPFAFLGGAARRAFDRQKQSASHPQIDYSVLERKDSVGDVISIANRLILDRVLDFGAGAAPPTTFFVSRAKRDATDYGDKLAEYLIKQGYACLFGDSEITGDRMAQPAIAGAILKSDVFIALWSASYATSMWCNDELELALERMRASSLRVWIFNLDGSDVVPRGARNLPQVVTRSSIELVTAVRDLLERSISPHAPG